MEKAIDFVKKNRKYVIWAGCAIIALACFLTFVKVKVSMFGYSTSTSIKFNDLADEYDEAISAYLVLAAAAASAVLVYLKKEKYSLIATAAALVITFSDFFKVRSEIKDAVTSGVKVSYVAPWIVLLGALVAAAPVVIDLLEDKGILKAKKAK